MRNTKIGILLISLITIIGLSSCSNSGMKSLGTVTNSTVEEFKSAINNPGATLVDIRTQKEYDAGHIEGSIMIDWKKRSFRNYVLNIPQDKPILIYCRSGNRSGKAASALQALGYTNIINLQKGIKQWKVEKQSLVTNNSKENMAFQSKAKSTTNDVDAVVAKMAKGGLGDIHNVSVDNFAKSMNLKNVTLVDVRTQKEYDEAHIEGASIVDWKQRSFKDLIAKVDKKNPVLIYCRSGNRSGKAASTMQALGFKNVYNLSGGVKAWKAAGKTLVK